MADNNFKLTLQTLLDTKGIKGQIKQLEKETNVKIKADGTQVKTTMRTIQDESGKAFRTMEKLDEGTGKVTGSIKELHKRSKSWGQDFVATFGKVAKFGAITAIIGGITTAIHESVQVVKDFDDAFTELRKVSDLGTDSLKTYTEELGELGKVTARTRTEMVEASTEFKKSGYTEKESAVLAQTATLFQNIADSQLSAGDASSIIISQLKAFNLTAEESIRITDVINEVDKLAFLIEI